MIKWFMTGAGICALVVCAAVGAQDMPPGGTANSGRWGGPPKAITRAEVETMVAKHFAMLDAEELGVTKANVDAMLKSDNPEIKRLLGVEGNFGEALGMTKDWAYRIVKLVGNYGESYDRNIGSGSPLKIERGLNRLWSKGGIQYAPPIR